MVRARARSKLFLGLRRTQSCQSINFVMVSFWPWKVCISWILPILLSILLTGSGRGQLPSLVRKSPVHFIHENRPGYFTARPATSDFSSLQGPLDPLLDVRLSVLFDYPCACVRMGELGIQRVYRHHGWTSLVRAPLTFSSHGD